jgi:autotransporter-associated beta strand protein
MFNVADVTGDANSDLTVSAKLLNTSANLVASGLTKTGAGTMALTATSSYTGSTNVNGGTLLVAASGGLAGSTLVNVAPAGSLVVNGSLSASATVNANGATSFGGSTGAAVLSRPLAALNIGTGATVLVTPSTFAMTPAVLQPGTLSFADGSAMLNLTNNELIDNESLTAAVARIVAGQINTTAAGGALGSLSLSSTQTEVRFTLLGDTNLDGKVDVTDLGNLASSYGADSGALWVSGDTNYDGKVDVTDLGNLASNYGGQLASGSAMTASSLATIAPGAGVAAVPEPGGLSVLTAVTIGLAARRRRHRRLS